jgi:hypothetical protein
VSNVRGWGYRTLATATGGSCARRTGYWECHGADKWVTGFGSATTIGDTIVDDEDTLRGQRLQHELAHVAQGRDFGAFYIDAWLVGAAISLARGRPDGDCNPLEIDADNQAGTQQYDPC